MRSIWLTVLCVVVILNGASASRRWEGEGSWDDDDEPSAGFWIVVGVAGAVAIVLVAMIIWYFCCPTQTAVTGTPAGGMYSAVLQNVQGSASTTMAYPPSLGTPGAVFTPSGVPLQSTKRE